MLKKLVSAILLIFTLAFLVCGCGKKGDTSSTNSAAVESEVLEIPDSINVTKADYDKEWVYDAAGFEDTAYHVPYINVNSEAVDSINSKLQKKYKELLETNKYQTVHYTFMEKGCVLSVYISMSTKNGWATEHEAYNISLGDGTQITDSRYMAAYLGLSDEEYRIAAATAVTNEYGSLYGSFSDSNYGQYKKYLELNQSEEITKELTGYINERGELSFCGQMYAMDGSKRSFAMTSATSKGGLGF